MFDTLGDIKDGMVPNGQDFLPLSGLATLDWTVWRVHIPSVTHRSETQRDAKTRSED